VHSLATYEGAATAIVNGQADYCVTLRPTEREIRYSCDCPIELDGEFCKHLVAAGLAWIDSDAEGKGKTGKKQKRATAEDDLCAFLEGHADVFGAEGLAEYRRLAEAEWARVRQLSPGDGDDEKHGRRFRITSMMEALARQTGDPEALVEVKRRDLSPPYSYFQIAEIYREAGQYDKALDWAEEGQKAFSQRDSRLVEFRAREYHRRGRYDDAMKIIWNQFVESPFLKNYQELKAHARKCSRVPTGLPGETRRWPICEESFRKKSKKRRLQGTIGIGPAKLTTRVW